MYDKENMIDVLDNFPEQCKEALNLATLKIKKKPKNIILCGMGGSGIAGDIASTFITQIPVFSVHGYRLPAEADKQSLVFVLSYSGNTEETLSCYNEAKRKGCEIIAITSGGKLAEKVKQTVLIPSGYQPRNALGFLLIPLLQLLTKAKIISNPGIPEAIKILDSKLGNKLGFLLAKQINGKIPVFYASEEMRFPCYRCKTQINENAKQPAFFHIFPEMNHNELAGFKKQANKVHIVFIKDSKDHPKIKKRMDIVNKIIKEDTTTSEIHTRGRGALARMFSIIYLGDYASYYLALMNKENPTPVEIIEEFKKKL